MLKIVDLILDYKESHNEKTAEEILKVIMPMIVKRVKKIRLDVQEDVIQDLKTSLFSIIQMISYRDEDMPLAVFNKDNLSFIKNANYSMDSIILVFNNKYVKNFIDEVGIKILEDAFCDEIKCQEFRLNFSKFSFRNQFYNILEKRFNSVMAAFYRKKIDYLSKEQLILNRETENGQEFIDLIPDQSRRKISFKELGFTQKDIAFLNLFIDGEKVYSQAEVAKMMGTSQQYISKRIREIRDRYKSNFYNEKIKIKKKIIY